MDFTLLDHQHRIDTLILMEVIDREAEIAHTIKPITLEKALEDYQKLQTVQEQDINENTTIGSRATDFFFFKYRLRIAAAPYGNFYECLDNGFFDKTSVSGLLKAKTKGRMVDKYYIWQLYRHGGGVSQFKPIIAKRLFCQFKPNVGILDFSAGWGGRLLAAMSLNIDYVGIDTNVNLKEAYELMQKTYPHNSKVTMLFEDSAQTDYSKFQYDLILTSPPYWKKEVYEHMPNYPTKNDFTLRFLKPVITNSYHHLQDGGRMAININQQGYDQIKTFFRKADVHQPFTLTKGPRANEYKEGVYIWIKTIIDNC